MRKRLTSVFAALFCIGAVAAVAFAQQVQPIDKPHAPPIVRPTMAPVIPAPTFAPTPTFAPAPTFAPMPTAVPGQPPDGLGQPPGTIVPLSQLPPLPPQNSSNTAVPGIDKRTFSATGASIAVTSSGTGCVNSVGTLFALGCTVNWQATGLVSGHGYKDYYVAPNVANGQGGTLVATYTGPTGGTHATALNVTGLYVFATLDTTTGSWATLTYVNVGAAYVVRVYQDSFHTQEGYQFDVSSSTAAYFYAQNLTASDYYVVYVESTSVTPQCVFVAPAASPAASAGQLCNPGNSAGVQAPGGALNVTFPITSALAAGTYSVVLYDKTQSERLGQVQISVTGSGGGKISLYGDGTGANPSPAPAPAGGLSTIFAYDSSNDRSTGGIQLSSTLVPTGNYVWTITDPNGQSFKSPTTALSGSGSYTFTLSSIALTPGNYVPKTFSAALYNTGTGAVFASQNFQMAGYYVVPTINGGSNLSISQGGSTPASLTFTNRSDFRYGSDNADSFASIIFTTGSDFTPSAGAGQGITAALSGFTAGTCASPGCTAVATDTAGNSWNVTDICTGGGTGECTIEFDPVVSTTTLAPGDSITLTNVGFANATGGNCSSGNSCSMQTAVLPAHGLTWSQINTVSDAYLPIYISAGNNLTGTASVALSGVNTASYTSASAETVEAHLFRPNTTHAQYHRSSPYSLGSSAYDIVAFTVKNSSSTNENVIAIGLPGSYGSLSALDNFAIDPNLNSATNQRWVIDTSCSTAAASFGRKYLCLDGTGAFNFGQTVSVPKNGGSVTVYLDMNAAPDAFTYSDWVVSLANPLVFGMTADPAKTATIPIGASGSFTVDGLAYAQYSLDDGLMQANFQPAVAGTNSTAAENIVVTNTPAAADPNPDYIDNVVIEIPSATAVTAPAAVTAGWSYLGVVTSGSNKFYWFSVCSSGQATVANLPPLTTPTARWPALTQCSAAQLANALAPGQSLTTSMNIAVGTTAVGATMYAHGANGDGWSSGDAMSLGVQAVSASVGFSAAGGYPTPSPVTTNNVPTIGGNPSATFGNAYTYSVKNTSASTKITSFAVIVPGTDINSVNATDTGGQTWTLTGTPTLSGNVDGCTIVGSQSATTAGADGYIDIGGASCQLLAGDTIKVNFTAIGPSSQGDSYQFGTQNFNASGTLNSTAAPGTTGAETWIGDSRIAVELSIGLNLTVNPPNPGPGGSNPIVTCATCSFAASTVDFGSVNNSTTANFGDVVRASVYITSTTAVTYTLSVSTNFNPTRTPASPTNELLTAVDSTHSSQSAGITFDATSATVVPTAGSLQLVHGTSITARSTPYDVIQNFQVNMGTEGISANTATLTYTLVAN